MEFFVLSELQFNNFYPVFIVKNLKTLWKVAVQMFMIIIIIIIIIGVHTLGSLVSIRVA